MKKVLFVLGLALCTTVAMGQAKKMVPRVGDGPQKANITLSSERPVDYKASIFTKDGEDQIVKVFNFAEDEMTGILYGSNCGLKTGDVIVVDGKDSTINDTYQHGRSEANTFWTRINRTDSIGSVTFNAEHENAHLYGSNSVPVYMGSQNGIDDNNGFMFIDMVEYFNNTGKGNMNAYFQLPAVAIPENTQIMDITWRQFHRKFYDQTFVDYKLDGKWNVVEVNVVNVDVNINGTSPSYYQLTLPPTAVNQSSLELRFRVSASDEAQVYGYMWAIDNVTFVVPEQTTRWSYNQPGYLDGFYGTLPQGFNIPLTYVIYGRNIGVTNLTNNTLSVNHVQGDSAVMTVNQVDLPYGDPSDNYLFAINERGFIYPGHGLDGTSGYYQSMPDFWESRQAYGGDAPIDSKYKQRGLPTATTGKNQFTIQATSADAPNGNVVLSGLVSDTMAYYVSPMVEVNNINSTMGTSVPGFRWGNDNSVVPSGSEYAYEFTDDGYITDDPQYGHTYQPNYELFTRFNSPSTIPTDENGNPWVFRGIELVTATTLTSDDVDGVRINPVCVVMAKNPSNNDSIGLYYMGNTGLNTDDVVVIDGKTAAPSELEYGVSAPGSPAHVVNIMLPAQPEIIPNTSYFFGYRNAEGGKFAVAGVQYYYMENADSSVRYSANPSVADFYRQFDPVYKVYDVYVVDGVMNRAISGWNINRYPMIHAIVGPKMDIPNYTVELSCTDDTSYWMTTGADESMCGMFDTVPQGSSAAYYVIPGIPEEMDEEAGVFGHMVIDEITIDGKAIDLTTATDNFDIISYNVVDPDHDSTSADIWPPLLVRNYYRITMRDMQEDHVIAAKASWHELSISEAEDLVHISMAPNPASSQVRLNVSGMTGMVNCSIIDMSGREVYASSFNAGSEQVISLNGVPAGAYFVRITNDSFSKVEKLIVR